MKLTALITSASQEVTIPVKRQCTSIKLLQAIHYKSSNTPKLLNIKIEECDNTNYYSYGNELFNYTFHTSRMGPVVSNIGNIQIRLRALGMSE